MGKHGVHDRSGTVVRGSPAEDHQVGARRQADQRPAWAAQPTARSDGSEPSVAATMGFADMPGLLAVVRHRFMIVSLRGQQPDT